MDALMNPPPDAMPDGEPTPVCELVVYNGRLAGMRRPLTGPLTLIGQAAGCEIRLNVEGVRPLHCAIVVGPNEVSLRDLGGEGVTRVNGEPVLTHTFRDGDLLTVGPFQFTVEINQSELDREREALRVQAAAVAAQQAALTEEEMRLQSRRGALEKQERQLAEHFEERQRELDVFQEQLEAGRQELAAERDRAAADRAAGAAEKSALDAEKKRLLELRARFKAHWARQWKQKDAALASGEAAVARERSRLEEQRGALQRDRTAFLESRLRHNGEVELSRRQLQHAWSELGEAQRQWEEGHRREETELERRSEAVAARAASLAAAEQALRRDREHWQTFRINVVRESEGLENRVRNMRTQVLRLQFERDALLQAEPKDRTSHREEIAPAVARSSDPSPAPAVLSRLAGNLMDQRRRLLEQWETLLRLHLAWKEERRQALADLNAAAQHLDERERQLDGIRQDVLARQSALRQCQDDAAAQRNRLDAWQARLIAREALWEADRAKLMAEVVCREEAAEASRLEVEQLRETCAESRRRELEQARRARARCGALRRHYGKLWRECQKQRAVLARAERSLATRVLAFERWREELLPRAEDAPSAEKRLDRLTRREESLRAETERKLASQEKALHAESCRLEQRARRLDQEQAALIAREEELAQQVSAFARQRTVLAEQDRAQREELARLRHGQATDQRHIDALRDEVERIARTLMGDQDTTSINQAA